MSPASRIVSLLVLHSIFLASASVVAEPHAPMAASEKLSLFAVQIRVGEKWDPAKAPHEQVLFREHSANLKRLRDAGHLVMGARYSDVGLIVLAADSETSARAMIDADPSISAGTFRYEIHRMNVFYPGTLGAMPAK